MTKLKKLSAFVGIVIATQVCAETLFFHNDADPFTPKGYDPVETLLPTDAHWQVYAGLSYVDYLQGTNNQLVEVIPSPGHETDLLAQMGQNTSVGFTAGFDRVMLFENALKTTMRGVAFGVMFHVDPTEYSGQVYQGELPAFNNYTYTYSVTPIDVAAEVELYPVKIYKWHMLPFIVLGGGFSAVDLVYSETPFQAGITTRDGSQASWVEQPLGIIGAGLEFDVSSNVFLKTQYLYHYRGTASVKPASFFGGVPINLNEQSVDFIAGLRF